MGIFNVGVSRRRIGMPCGAALTVDMQKSEQSVSLMVHFVYLAKKDINLCYRYFNVMR